MLKFEWDAANTSHIAEHKVTTDEAEQVVLNEPFDIELQSRKGEMRTLQVGETNHQRILVVVTTRRGDLLRVVTAFPANKTYRTIYAAEKGKAVKGKEDEGYSRRVSTENLQE